MSSIRMILVPIDFSETADGSLTYAIDLAGRLGAKLKILHALHVPAALSPSVEWWEKTRKAALEGLEVARRQAEDAGKVCEVELSDDYPVDAIVRAATETPADLIVMGTHGHSGLVHAWLGSVAERTLRQAPCPVITIPHRRASS